MGALHPDKVARFRADLTAIVGDLAVAHDQFGIAVSGGPDSMALALLAHALLGDRALAATVDHGLRPEAAGEAQWVNDALTARGMRHAILTGQIAPGASVQAQARALRYALLHRWCDEGGIGWLLTAHHADDQRETLVMRMNRQSGVGGMAGIRARNGRVVRPLLGWRRAALQQIVDKAGCGALTDPSNADPAFDRVRVRAALADADWLDPLAVSGTAAAMADADAALNWAVERIVADWPETSDAPLLIDAGYPREIRRRLLLRQLHRVEPGLAVRGAALDRLVDGMGHGEAMMIGNWRLIPIADPSPDRRRWAIIAAPPRKSAASMTDDDAGGLPKAG